MESSKNYKDLLLAMTRIGVLGFGGGPSVIPLFRYEAVTKYGWLSDSEFGEILALANALPGPIATKMAAYLGYRQKGKLGAVSAVVASILPTCLATVGLYGVFTSLHDSKVVQGMISAVLPVVAVMLGMMAYEFCYKAYKGLGVWIGTAAGVLAFLLLRVFHVNPGIVVALFLAYGSVHLRWYSAARGSGMKKEG